MPDAVALDVPRGSSDQHLSSGYWLAVLTSRSCSRSSGCRRPRREPLHSGRIFTVDLAWSGASRSGSTVSIGMFMRSLISDEAAFLP